MGCSGCSSSFQDARTLITKTVPETFQEIYKQGKTTAIDFTNWVLSNKAFIAGGVTSVVAVAALSYYVGMRIIPTLVVSLVSTPLFFYASVGLNKPDEPLSSEQAVIASLGFVAGFASFGVVPFLLTSTMFSVLYFKSAPN